MRQANNRGGGGVLLSNADTPFYTNRDDVSVQHAIDVALSQAAFERARAAQCAVSLDCVVNVDKRRSFSAQRKMFRDYCRGLAFGRGTLSAKMRALCIKWVGEERAAQIVALHTPAATSTKETKPWDHPMKPPRRVSDEE